ncbi:hypothetical protein [Veillonella sp.]|uniref:hypothetical protein n=1 Tax=Veillonella sp. TaxID=1926307 RepID=UPI0025FF0D1C|nr:hypothetical protein [Veillonella sp.]
MNSTRIVKAVDRLKWSTKLVFGLLLKLILLLVWGASIWGIYTLLYDRYVLEAYPLGDYLLVLIVTFGNICILPWLILWYKKIYPAFDKPKMYYGVKAWYISLKEQSLVGLFIFYSIDFVIKLGLLIYGIIIVLAIVIFVSLTWLRF